MDFLDHLSGPVATAAILPVLMVAVRALLVYVEKKVEEKSKVDVYVLTVTGRDEKSHNVKVVIKKAATQEERAKIINEKARQLSEESAQGA